MHSLFMLVFRSCASVRNDSCRLLGNRTVITPQSAPDHHSDRWPARASLATIC